MRAVLFTLAGLLALGAAGCSPKPPPRPEPSGTARAPSQATASPAPVTASPEASPGPIKAVSRGTERQPARYIVRDKSGAVVYDIRSSTVTYDRASDGSGVATFADPQVVFHSRSRRTVVADSPKAVAHDRDKSVTMTGGVHAKTDDGKMLTCSTLTYDARDQRILCEGDVVLRNTATNQTASGERLVTDPDFDHVVLSGSR